MLFRSKKDSDGKYYCQWGSGKKYYYNPNDEASKEAARKKANEQGQAAHAGGYEGSEKSIDILENKKEEEKPKVPNPDEPGEEDKPGEEDNEEEELRKKSLDIPKTFEEIKENCYIVHKGKIAKIVKVLEK